MKSIGSLTLSNGQSISYMLLTKTFNIPEGSNYIFAEFWQEDGKSYLTGIAPKSSPPVNSIFKFSRSICIKDNHCNVCDQVRIRLSDNTFDCGCTTEATDATAWY